MEIIRDHSPLCGFTCSSQNNLSSDFRDSKHKTKAWIIYGYANTYRKTCLFQDFSQVHKNGKHFEIRSRSLNIYFPQHVNFIDVLAIAL